MEVRDCAKFVKVVIEKVDDRNAERIRRTEILDRFVKNHLPQTSQGQEEEEEKEKDGESHKFSYWTFKVLLGVLLTCYKARVTSVEYNKVPEKAYVFTFTELGTLRLLEKSFTTYTRL